MLTRKRQDAPRLRHRAVFTSLPNGLAPELGINRGRLFRGLERFVNTGDSLEEFEALGKGWQGFWPIDVTDATGQDLAWTDGAHPLFLYCRDKLRRVWQGDPGALKDGEVAFLLGVLPEDSRLSIPLSLLRNWHPSARVRTTAVLWPDWKTGDVYYASQNDFQRAFYYLFREPWRARVCPECKAYFVAAKPRQTYCSIVCSNKVARRRKLTWWRKAGQKLRRINSDRAAPRAKRSARPPKSRKAKRRTLVSRRGAPLRKQRTRP